MAIDLAALKAKIAAQKAANATAGASNENTASTGINVTTNVVDGGNSQDATVSSMGTGEVVPTVKTPEKLGTSKTSEIDHLDFLSKMNSLSEAILKQHPTMPVLLKQIHTQLRNDPELVTTLDEDAIGIIVKGLQVQTKTELVQQVIKDTSSGRKKKSAAIDIGMF